MNFYVHILILSFMICSCKIRQSQVQTSTHLARDSNNIIYQHFSNSENKGVLNLVYEAQTTIDWRAITAVYYVEDIEREFTSNELDERSELSYIPLIITQDGILSTNQKENIDLQNVCMTFIIGDTTLYVTQWGNYTFGEALTLMNDREQAKAAGELCLDGNSKIGYLNNRSMTAILSGDLAKISIEQYFKTNLSASTGGFFVNLGKKFSDAFKLKPKLSFELNSLKGLERLRGSGTVSLTRELKTTTNKFGSSKHTYVTKEYQMKVISKHEVFHYRLEPANGSKGRSVEFAKFKAPTGIAPTAIDASGNIHYFINNGEIYINVKSLAKDTNLSQIQSDLEAAKAIGFEGSSNRNTLLSNAFKAEYNVGGVSIGVSSIFGAGRVLARLPRKDMNSFLRNLNDDDFINVLLKLNDTDLAPIIQKMDGDLLNKFSDLQALRLLGLKDSASPVEFARGARSISNKMNNNSALNTISDSPLVRKKTEELVQSITRNWNTAFERRVAKQIDLSAIHSEAELLTHTPLDLSISLEQEGLAIALTSPFQVKTSNLEVTIELNRRFLNILEHDKIGKDIRGKLTADVAFFANEGKAANISSRELPNYIANKISSKYSKDIPGKQDQFKTELEEWISNPSTRLQNILEAASLRAFRDNDIAAMQDAFAKVLKDPSKVSDSELIVLFVKFKDDKVLSVQIDEMTQARVKSQVREYAKQKGITLNEPLQPSDLRPYIEFTNMQKQLKEMDRLAPSKAFEN